MCMGCFYIYVASTSFFDTSASTMEFTNNLDDIVSVNDTYEVPLDNVFSTSTEFTTAVLTETGKEESVGETTENKDADDITTTEIPYTNEDNKILEDEAVLDKNNKFLQRYKNFIKNALRQNGSIAIFNESYVYKRPMKSKEARRIEEEPASEDVQYLLFENCLLAYSFLQCFISLLNNSVYCRQCVSEIDNNKRSDTESGGDLESEKEGNEAQNTSDKVTTVLTHTRQGSSDSRNKIVTTAQILILWILPVVVFISLYSSVYSSITPIDNDSKILTNYINGPNISHVFQNPIKISTNSSEIDNIIQSVYHIVNSTVQGNVNKKSKQFMTFLTNKGLHKNSATNLIDFELSLSLTNSTLILAYVVGAFYVVIVYSSLKSKENSVANQLKRRFLSFVVLWMPSVFCMFFRTYMPTNGSFVWDMCLALGNADRICTTVFGYQNVKNSSEITNVVTPIE
nr:unnamed protein product [Callosobruchus analis]